jgi:hypothetical protein
MRREAVALNPFGESRQGQVSFPQQASLNGPLFGSKRDLKIAVGRTTEVLAAVCIWVLDPACTFISAATTEA